MTKKRILLFGGAFNPPHKGHEALFSAAVRALRPEFSVILPTAHSPHKESDSIKFAHRAAMCGVFRQYGDVKISLTERRGRKKRNYSIQTIKQFQKRYPGREICFLIGGDMLKSFHTWSRYRRILNRTVLVAAARENGEDAALAAAVCRLRSEGARIILLEVSPVEASSSEIRALLKRGEDAGRYLSGTVRDYIKKQRLYFLREEAPDGFSGG